MQDIIQTVQEYLSRSNTDYALLLEGVWGSGKSYFVKHKLNDAVQQLAVPEGEEGVFNKTKAHFTELDSHYSLTYISLNGLSNIQDFHSRVISNTFPDKVGNIAAKGLSMALSWVESKLCKVSDDVLSSLTPIRGHLLVFDDLERISDKITVKEVLGAINNFVEHDHAKVLIVCNEEQIKDTEFQTYKEKNIRFQLKYNPLLTEMYDCLLEGKATEYGEDFTNFLRERKMFICELFQIGQCHNLRTLSFVFDVLIWLHSKTQGRNYDSNVIDALVRFVTVYSIEYKNGHTDRELEELLMLRDKMMNLGQLAGELNPEENKSTDPLDIYTEDLHERYSSIKPAWLYLNAIEPYIRHGFVSDEAVIECLNSLQNEFNEAKVKPQYQVYHKLNNSNELEDAEIPSLIEELLGYVKDKFYSLSELFNVLNLFMRYSSNHWGEFCIKDHVGEFVEAISNKPYAYDANFENFHPANLYEPDTEEGRIYNQLRDIAVKVNSSTRFGEFRFNYEEIKAAVANFDRRKLAELASNHYNARYFAAYGWKDVIPYLAGDSSKHAVYLVQFIAKLYPKGIGYKPDEIRSVKEELLPWLEDYVKTNPTLLRTATFKELIGHIKHILQYNIH